MINYSKYEIQAKRGLKEINLRYQTAAMDTILNLTTPILQEPIKNDIWYGMLAQKYGIKESYELVYMDLLRQEQRYRARFVD